MLEIADSVSPCWWPAVFRAFMVFCFSLSHFCRGSMGWVYHPKQTLIWLKPQALWHVRCQRHPISHYSSILRYRYLKVVFRIRSTPWIVTLEQTLDLLVFFLLKVVPMPKINRFVVGYKILLLLLELLLVCGISMCSRISHKYVLVLSLSALFFAIVNHHSLILSCWINIIMINPIHH